MKFYGLLLLLTTLFINIESHRIRPITKSYYKSIFNRYGPRRAQWNNQKKYGLNPYSLQNFKRFGHKHHQHSHGQHNKHNLKLQSQNARIISRKVETKPIEVLQHNEFDFDYNRRPRICPHNFISKCYTFPHYEYNGKPARKCLTLCKGKPCFKPCLCQCIPKQKAKFSKALIPHLMVPVDKSHLIPPCHANQMVSCRAQIYGESTDELCALGCGEGVCPLTCNCRCVADMSNQGQIPVFNRDHLIDREMVSPAFTLPSAPGFGEIHTGIDFPIGPGIGFGESGLADIGVADLGNGIVFEGLGLSTNNREVNDVSHSVNFNNDVDRLRGLDNGVDLSRMRVVGNDNGLILDGFDLAAAGTAGGSGILFTDGTDVVGGIRNIQTGTGSQNIITDGTDGIILDNAVSVFDGRDMSPVPVPLRAPVSFLPSPDNNAMPIAVPVPDVIAPLQGIETETVQVKIDVQTPPTGAGGAPSKDVLMHNSAQNGQSGIPVALPHEFGPGGKHGINNWNTGMSGQNGGPGGLDAGFGNSGAVDNWNNGINGQNGGPGGFDTGFGNSGAVDNWNNGMNGQNGGTGGIDAGLGNFGGIDQGAFGVGKTQGGGQSTWDQGNSVSQVSASGWNQGSSTSSNTGGTNANAGGNQQLGVEGTGNNLKLKIPPANGNKKGGAINLDLSGILNQINGGGENGGIGGGELEGLFQNQEFNNMFGGGTGSPLGTPTLNGNGMNNKRSDTLPFNTMGTNKKIDAFSFGSGTQTTGTQTGQNDIAALFPNLFNDVMGEQCQKGFIKSCSTTPTWKSTPGLDQWCKENCPKGVCDQERCTCSCVSPSDLLMSKIV